MTEKTLMAPAWDAELYIDGELVRTHLKARARVTLGALSALQLSSDDGEVLETVLLNEAGATGTRVGYNVTGMLPDRSEVLVVLVRSRQNPVLYVLPEVVVEALGLDVEALGEIPAHLNSEGEVVEPNDTITSVGATWLDVGSGALSAMEEDDLGRALRDVAGPVGSAGPALVEMNNHQLGKAVAYSVQVSGVPGIAFWGSGSIARWVVDVVGLRAGNGIGADTRATFSGPGGHLEIELGPKSPYRVISAFVQDVILEGIA